MRYLLLLLISCHIALTGSAKKPATPIEKLDIKKNFGAKGDGIHNDQNAFNAAANYINRKKGNCILEIPNGTYLVGYQRLEKGSNYSRHIGETVFKLMNCRHVIIHCSGTLPAQIKYADGFYFGTFDQHDQIVHHKLPYKDEVDVSLAGYLFYFEQCDDIQIVNLHLNGNINSGNMHIGGEFGDHGWQIYHTGITFVASSHMLIKKVSIENFGLDAIYLVSGKNILIQQCHLFKCGRQGFSWIGGDSVRMENTRIEQIGKGLISSSPAAGIDIEPSGSENCTHGLFNDVSIEQCAGECLVSDRAENRCEHMQFNRCRFINSSNWSILTRNKDFNFNHCLFTGCVTDAYAASNWKDATKFISCSFNQCSDGQIGYYKWLINIQKLPRVLFDSCTFNAYSKKLIHLTAVSNLEDEKPIIQNCHFVFNGTTEQLQEELAGDNTVAEFGFCILRNNVFKINPGLQRIYGLPTCTVDNKGARIQPLIITQTASCE